MSRLRVGEPFAIAPIDATLRLACAVKTSFVVNFLGHAGYRAQHQGRCAECAQWLGDRRGAPGRVPRSASAALATPQPQLLNLPPTPGVPLPFNLNLNENMPLRNLPLVVNNVPGAVPNPTSSAILRAGELQDRATYFRDDLAFAANPQSDANPGGIPKNPHTFLTNIDAPARGQFAVMAQSQIAAFFASNGALTIDPDGPSPFFEVPVVLPLPEALNFIP